MATASLTILAVDDTQDNLTILKARLADAFPGARVFTALSGQEAIDLALMEDPDVILLDIVMPVTDGFAVCRTLKGDQRLRHIPVIFLTAAGTDSQSRVKALETGAEAFLTTPIEGAELTAQIRAMARIKAANVSERREKERLAALVAERTNELEQELAERERAEEHLREGEDQWRRVLATAMDGFWMVGRGGRILEANEAACRMGGYSRDELLRMSISELEAAESAVDVERHIQRIQTKGWDRFETRHRHKDGSLVEVEISTTYHAEADLFFAFLRDITERKRAEEALRASEERYRGLFEHMVEGFAHCRMIFENGDPRDFIYLTVNSAFETLTGLKNVGGRRVSEVVPGIREADPELFEIYGRVALTGEPHKFEMYVQALGMWFSMSVYSPQQGDFVAVFDVITERKRVEKEREELQLELAHAQRMESIGRLAGGVAHDFNNLLTVINGYSALVLGRLQREDPSRPALEQIHRAGERAAALVRQLLAFSRKQVLEPEVLDLNVVIADIETMLQRLVGEDVEVTVRPAPSLGSVMADRRQLEQVIMNLAANARDAMPGGGTLTLETDERWMSGTCPVCEQKIVPGLYVELIVRDTGEGMDGPTRLRLFEPFFTTKGVGLGTGLGLSAVQGIVVQSGGHIGIESEPGKGTVFHVYLPLVAQPPDQIETQPAAASAGGAETILVVEDRAEVREFTAAVLESYGYRVLRAEDGDRALGLCADQPVDLLLTDVVMPKMSGVELARRALSGRPELKTLFMSGYSAEVHEGRGEDLAGAPFLQKPFFPQALAAKVRETLGTPLRAARLLVVDDEEDVRQYLRRVLEDSGYEVLEAADGRQALQCLGAGRVDLVITDLVMPGLEGIETIQAIRGDHPELGIIAISGAGEGAYLQFAKRLGADASLQKPLSAGRLLAEVEKGLHARR